VCSLPILFSMLADAGKSAHALVAAGSCWWRAAMTSHLMSRWGQVHVLPLVCIATCAVDAMGTLIACHEHSGIWAVVTVQQHQLGGPNLIAASAFMGSPGPSPRVRPPRS
jgi:hypothetical protein